MGYIRKKRGKTSRYLRSKEYGVISDRVLNPLTTIKGFLELKKKEGLALDGQTLDLLIGETEKIEVFIKAIDP